MVKIKSVKAVFAFLMLVILTFLFSNSVNAANIDEIKTLERGELGYYCVQKWDGNKWIYLTYSQTFYNDKDNQKYLAYCLSPGNPGIGYVSGEKESYDVKIEGMLDDDRIWRVLKNGYPNNSINELNVETEDDAYFATMQAINAILRGYSLEEAQQLYSVGKFSINGENYEDIQRRGNKTVDLMLRLIDIGINGTETRNQLLDISVKSVSELVKEENNMYSQTFEVISSSDILEYNIEQIDGLPEGSFVCDEKGNKTKNFKGTDVFKVMIPGENILNDINGKITVKAQQKNYPIYFGKSQVEGFQNYALCNNIYSKVYASASISIESNKSNLTIIKVDSKNGQPIEKTKFKVTYSDGKVNTFLTDSDGKIYITGQKPGNVKIKEVEANDKYKLNDEEISVYLQFNEAKEIKIENELCEEEKEVPEDEVKEIKEEITPVETTEQNEELEHVEKELPRTGRNMSKNLYQIISQPVAILILIIYNKYVKKKI